MALISRMAWWRKKENGAPSFRTLNPGRRPSYASRRFGFDVLREGFRVRVAAELEVSPSGDRERAARGALSLYL